LDLTGIALDLPEVERLARLLSGSDDFSLVFTAVGPASAPLSRLWSTTVQALDRDLLWDQEAMASPLVRRAAFEQLALAALHVFPSTLMELRAPRDVRRAVPGSVRRALAYIDDHLEEEIMVPDIATAAGLSVRGLSAAFRRELGTTPSARLRSERLAAARRDLRDAGAPHGGTVGAIARRWGFRNAGRFAELYRARFGVSPWSTLRD
jgi:transcriptional regulator GlxA family with amidase domain